GQPLLFGHAVPAFVLRPGRASPLPAFSPSATIGPAAPSRKAILAEHRARPASPACPAPFDCTGRRGQGAVPQGASGPCGTFPSTLLTPAVGLAAAPQLGPAPCLVDRHRENEGLCLEPGCQIGGKQARKSSVADH